MNCAGVVRVLITAKLEILQTGNFCKSQAGMKSTTTPRYMTALALFNEYNYL